MKPRCSSLDRLLACPGSAAPAPFPFNPSSEAAIAGTAKHLALALAQPGEAVDFGEIAHASGVEADDLRSAVGTGRRVVDEIRGWCSLPPTVQTEVRLDGPVCSGTADWIASVYDGDGHTPADGPLLELVVLDWKTGWSGDEHPAQTLGYASAARAQFGMPTSGRLTTVEAWLRLGERRVKHYTSSDLDAFEARVAAAVASVASVTPGTHCGFCPRRLVCEPRHDYVRAASMAVARTCHRFEKGVAITREQLGALYEQYRTVTAAARLYEKLLGDELELGPIALPDGRQLALVTSERKVLDPHPALAVLEDHAFSAAELRECVSVSKSAVERVAREKAGKGKGAALMREITAGLDKAEAWQTEIVRTKKVLDAPKTVEQLIDAASLLT